MPDARQGESQSVQIFEPEPGQLYHLEAAAYLAGVSRRSLLLYCLAGLIRPLPDPQYGALFFDERAIHAVRRAEALRTGHGINPTGVAIIFDLLRELEQLRQEVRFLRGF